LHDVVLCALQLPVPSQDDARDSVPPAQLWAAQVTVGYVHEVLPEQLPLHALVPAHAAREPCGCPDGTGEHVPCNVATSHAWHDPVHAMSQQ